MEKVNSSKSKWKTLKKLFDNKLKHQIEERPPDVIKKFVHSSLFKELNESKIIITSQAQGTPGGIIIISSFIFIFFLFLKGNKMLMFPGIIITSILSLLILFGILYKLTIPKKEIVLDRKNQIFTFPGYMWKKEVTLSFNELIVGWYGSGGVTGNLQMELVCRHPKEWKKGARLYGHSKLYYENWSFYVWYMDKNRPLPPGDAFDPYREKDFLRRKAAGFPPPLYESYIPTPEATTEQQSEREQYWTDEQYTEAFEREEGSGWYDSKIHTDWQEAIFYEPNTEVPVANKYVKFIFKDGRIVYSKTNNEGSLFEPPENEGFEMQFVTVKK